MFIFYRIKKRVNTFLFTKNVICKPLNIKNIYGSFLLEPLKNLMKFGFYKVEV